MNSLQEQAVTCPYCAEQISVLIDQEESGHEYIEDCQVCCKPIIFSVTTDAMGYVLVSVRDENETN